MSERAKEIHSYIKLVEGIRLKIFNLHDRRDLGTNVQSLIHDVGDALIEAESDLLQASKNQASHDFLKEVENE